MASRLQPQSYDRGFPFPTAKPWSWLPVPNQLKYFTEYNDNDGIRPLCVRFPQMTGYVKKIEFNLTISFKISDKQLLKKYYPI